MTETIDLDTRKEIRYDYLLNGIEQTDKNGSLFRDYNVRNNREWYYLTRYILNGKSVDHFMTQHYGTPLITEDKHREVPLKALETVGLTKEICNIYDYLNVMKKVMKKYKGTWVHDELSDVEPLRLKLEELLTPTLF